MTEKDKANPRQRITMEERWEKARRDCAYERCDSAYRFHAAGCPRRQQKIKVTNLNTGVISEATIVHSDVRAVKDVMDQHDKQAIRLEPETWTPFERGQRAELFEPRVIPVPKPEDTRALTPDEKAIRDTFLTKLEQAMTPPARPWWKFWGRRG